MTTKWLDLFTLLKSGTESGRVQWVETADDDAYMASISRNKVIFENGRGIPGGYRFHILSPEGRTVDTFDVHDLAMINGYPLNDQAEEMFSTIRRRISGADRVLDDILADLRDEDPF